MSDASGGLAIAELPSDPDRQATVTDFLDYTEYLPADLVRSLTLIGKLDTTYLDAQEDVHELTKEYGSLPSVEGSQDPLKLRAEISEKLSRAINAREASYAEASRLYDVIDRHFNRLTSIINKLQALPLPPSRDPTPPPEPARSPQTQRSRGRGRPQNIIPQRITLRLDGARAGAGLDSNRKGRGRKYDVPDTPNLYSPPISTDSDWESFPPSPLPMPRGRVGRPPGSGAGRGRVKVPKGPKTQKIKVPKAPRVRAPGQMGTNVHSAVAGISTSNALALLKPPPADAIHGSEDAPWLRLTAYELARLRKRMKKNAVWQPSDTMIARELKTLGRGVEAWRKANKQAQETGEPVPGTSVAKPNEEATAPEPEKPLAEGEIRPDALGEEEVELSNRGMKLNQAKKIKKEAMARAAAEEAALEAEAAAQRLAAAGRGLAKGLFPAGGEESATAATSTPKERENVKSVKKRKAPEEDTAKPDATEAPKKKRKKETPAPLTTTISVPLAAPGPSPISPKRTRQASSAREPPATAPRPRSRGQQSTRSSLGPPPPTPSTRPRRASTTSVPAIQQTAASRKGRRAKPAPGPVTDDGAISVGRRKAAPRGKKGKAAGRKKEEEQAAVEEAEVVEQEQEEEDMEIDPNEPTYCVCERVSFGVMVMCENSECEREWFHLECVGLTAPPGRTAKWYCPECKEKLGIGQPKNATVAGRKKR